MSKSPVVPASTTPRLEARRREAWWLAAAVAAYVFWPGSIPKFFFLAAALWLVCRVFQPQSRTVGCAGFAATLYATTFLLTPVCASQALRVPGATASPSALVQLALLAFGCLWVGSAGVGVPPGLARVAAVRGRVVCLWALVLIGASSLTWTADIAYGGDEHYHLKALVVNHTIGLELAERGWLAALAWLGAGVWLGASRAGGLQSPSGASVPSTQRLQAIAIWAMAGLALAACAPWLYTDAFLANAFNQDRMLRYPGSQPWLSTALWELARANWGTGVLFGFEVLRFTPVLAVFALGLVLVQEKRWRAAPPLLPLLGALALATIPTLIYHGTLLYLELALIPLLVLLVRDGRRWLLASPERLAGGNAWWAALALGFLKDTGIIAVGILWLVRAAVRGTCLARRGEWSVRALMAEARVAFVTLGPGVLYLLLRSLHGSRPYQPHFENFLSAEVWLQAARGVAEQFGILWLPALAGVWLLARRRAWAQLLAAAALFGGMWFFHLIEEPRWVGLARFNLLLLPAVLALAWEGLGALVHRRATAMVAMLLLLAGNALLSPADRTGQRAVWGGSGERWYDYTDCLADLRKLKPDAHLALANVAHSYGIGMTLQRLDWWTDVVDLPVANPNDALASLRVALEMAGRGDFDFVIFRWDGRPEVAPGFQHGSYRRISDYSSRGGTLTVFARQLGNMQSPQ
ncbi:MAG: hypothetical protein HZA92_09980 [Verrucomicrobia bacterium]|nr:hypothetical protein [Verrucomicrobiota bacterium]